MPEQARLDVVLERMRARATGQAICVDERGTVVGLLRAEDIVDELLAGMGEHHEDEKHAIHLVGLGVWSVRGVLGARDWAQSFNISESAIADSLPRSATVGGIVLERLGRLAQEGDEVIIGPARLRVARVTGRRIDEIEVSFVEPHDAPTLGGGADA